MKVLLDTHAVLWWQAGGDRLSAAAIRDIAKADTNLVSQISFWEIATLATKKRIALDRDVFLWARDLMSQPGLDVAALTPQAAMAAAMLSQQGFHGDPADRLLYATARDLVVPLVKVELEDVVAARLIDGKARGRPGHVGTEDGFEPCR